MPGITPAARRRRTAVASALAVALVGSAGYAAVQTLGGPVVVQERCTAVVEGQEFVLAPDQAANAATITAIAVRRGLPARAATIAIATAIQESKLRNLDYGDRDSVGLFQQRTSQGWGTVEQIMDPVYATNAFYDALVEVDGYESMEITVASDRVQRSAFPDAVADHEPEGRAFASALTGYSPAALTCRLRPVDDATAAAGSDAVAQALTAQLGDVPVDQVDAGTLAVDAGGGSADGRMAWTVASWAVAQAGELGVTEVQADGMVWRRDQPDDGWQPVDDPSGQALEAAVLIRTGDPAGA